MSYQNQNRAKPDYGFILNQQSNQPKAKKSKKLIILAITVVLLLVVAVASLLLGDDTTKQSASVSPSSHLTLLAQRNFPAAYAELSSKTKNTFSEGTYKEQVADVLGARIDIASCQPNRSKQDPNAEFFTCKNADGSMRVLLKVVTVTENGKLRIDQYFIVGAEKNT